MARLTEAQRKALEWFKTNEPVSWFPCDGSGPSLRFVKRLTKLGLVEQVGKEFGNGFGAFGFTKYARTAAGRRALEEQEQER